MIISASRRTDIPAFYSDWFMRQIMNGKIYRKNPYNGEIYCNDISPDNVDVIVFWTRNPKPMIEKGYLSQLQNLGYRFYFQYTITGYNIKSSLNKNIDGNTPHPLKSIDTFNQLADLIGKEKIIHRFDPVVICDQITKQKIIKNYREISKRIPEGIKTVISFLDVYNHVSKNMSNYGFTNIKDLTKNENKNDLDELLLSIMEINKLYQKEMFSCSENIDLSIYNIKPSKCIDEKYIQNVFGIKVSRQKDKGQREDCGCVKSIDVGQYETCPHGCVYCYANKDHKTSIFNLKNNKINNGLIIPDERTWLDNRII